MAARACHRRASLNPPGWAGSRQTEIGCGRVTWACVAMEWVSHLLVEPLALADACPLCRSRAPGYFCKDSARSKMMRGTANSQKTCARSQNSRERS